MYTGRWGLGICSAWWKTSRQSNVIQIGREKGGRMKFINDNHANHEHLNNSPAIVFPNAMGKRLLGRGGATKIEHEGNR